MLQYDFEDSVGCWIAGTSHAVRRAMDAELAKENITYRQWEVLAWLSFAGEQTQAELSDRIGIEAPTLAGVIQRMERDGWLEKSCCTQDRRKKYIRPTPQAEAVWNRMVECCHKIRRKAIDGISPEHLQILKSTCETIRVNLGWPLEQLLQTEAMAGAPGRV
ncbi:MAG: MarR family winged helix-turn-helix transcriptional regulator [Planctomycetaceae bacterium]